MPGSTDSLERRRPRPRRRRRLPALIVIIVAGLIAVAVAFGQAALTENTVVRAGAANTTATNLLAALGEDEGLAIVNNGTDMDTATALDYFVWYVVTEAHR